MAKIQVILLEDVAGQGRKGEIVTVSDGYARNFLFNNKKGVLATPEELQKIENRKKKEAKKHEEERNKSLELKKLLESKVLNIPVKAGENGKLFGAITSKEIATQIKEDSVSLYTSILQRNKLKEKERTTTFKVMFDIPILCSKYLNAQLVESIIKPFTHS